VLAKDAAALLGLLIAAAGIALSHRFDWPELDFAPGVSAAEAATATTALQGQVRAAYPVIKRLFIEAAAAAPP